MAYSGSTASSSVANPPRCIVGGALYGAAGATTGLSTTPDSPNNQGGGVWFYASTNKTTDLTNGTFFTDGKNLGMRPGDLVVATQFTSAGSSVVVSMHPVTAVSTLGAELGGSQLLSSTRASSL
jgi:hypothetical protein